MKAVVEQSKPVARRGPRARHCMYFVVLNGKSITFRDVRFYFFSQKKPGRADSNTFLTVNLLLLTVYITVLILEETKRRRVLEGGW